MSLSQCLPVSCAEFAALLLPHLAGTVVEAAGEAGGRVVLLVRPGAARAACPGCGTLSGRVHGGYPRRLHDVPAGGRDVVNVALGQSGDRHRNRRAATTITTSRPPAGTSCSRRG